MFFSSLKYYIQTSVSPHLLAHIYQLPQINFTPVFPKKRAGLPGTLIKHVKTCYNNLGTKHHITGEQIDPVKDTQP